MRGDQTALREALFMTRETIRERKLEKGSRIYCLRPYNYHQGCKLYHSATASETCPTLAQALERLNR